MTKRQVNKRIRRLMMKSDVLQGHCGRCQYFLNGKCLILLGKPENGLHSFSASDPCSVKFIETNDFAFEDRWKLKL
jgi:hypothetical protein